MTYLIDTHVLLWHMTGDPRLVVKYVEEIKNLNNTIFVSRASLWEIAIKISIGKLITRPIIQFESYLKENNFQELEYDYRDLQKVTELPFHHNDPFDRLIISQAINRNLTVITDDNKFKLYPIQLLKSQ